MTHYLRATPALFRVGFASMVAYRAEMIIWILSATMPLIMLALWNAVTAEGSIAGFGQVEMARYFTATLVVRQLTSCWLVWQFNWEVKTGGLSPKLLRPLNPLWFEGLTMLAAMPFRALVLFPLLAALVLWRPDLVAWPGALALLLAAVSTAMAFALQFLVQSLFGMISFWWDQSMGLFNLWFGAWMLLSGYVAPIAVFPAWARSALDVLPFRYMLGLPVELLGGFLAPEDALGELGVQLLWIVVLGLLARWMWARGIARYGAFGA